MLSNTSKYAVRAIMYLALNKDKNHMIGIKQISTDLNIPAPFLSKILQLLAKQKFLISSKGPNGGFSLGRDPGKISIMDILKAIDGMDVFKRCVMGMKYCSEQNNPCVLHSYYSSFRDDIKAKFEEVTFAKIVDEIKQGRQELYI